jgi:hypothetical protein
MMGIFGVLRRKVKFEWKSLYDLDNDIGRVT